MPASGIYKIKWGRQAEALSYWLWDAERALIDYWHVNGDALGRQRTSDDKVAKMLREAVAVEFLGFASEPLSGLAICGNCDKSFLGFDYLCRSCRGNLTPA